MTVISSSQIRAARALLDWSMLDLAKAARVSVSTVKRCEDGRDVDAVVGSVQDALEIEGVRFLFDDGNGIGLRYRPR